MPDRCRDAGLLGDREHLVERSEDPVPLGSLMGEIAAPVPGRDSGQGDELVRTREAVRHVHQRRAHAEGALLHGLGRQLFHLVELGGRRRPVVVADHIAAQAPGPHKGGHVDRRMDPLLHAFKEIAQRPPIGDHTEVRGQRRGLRDHPVIDGRDGMPLPGHLRRHSLHDLGGGTVVDEQGELGLAQHVDETRSDDEPGGVDAPARRGRAKVADGLDPIP